MTHPAKLGGRVPGCTDFADASVSDQHNIGDTNDDPKICAITDQFTHLSTYPSDQEAIF
jgi:hypothetical protein